MSTAVRRCKVCKRVFKIEKGVRRTTCSSSCMEDAKRQGYELSRKLLKDEPTGEVQESEQEQCRYWVPTPEEIARQCSLIRSGKLVITAQGPIWNHTN